MLEAKIDALTAALEANTRALLHAGKTAPVIGADPAAIASTAAATKDKPAEKKAEAAKPAAAPAAPAGPTYDDVAKEFLALVTSKGRDVALATIAPLPALNKLKDDKGVPHEQHAGQYAEFLAKIRAAAKEEPALV